MFIPEAYSTTAASSSSSSSSSLYSLSSSSPSSPLSSTPSSSPSSTPSAFSSPAFVSLASLWSSKLYPFSIVSELYKSSCDFYYPVFFPKSYFQRPPFDFHAPPPSGIVDLKLSFEPTSFPTNSSFAVSVSAK